MNSSELLERIQFPDPINQSVYWAPVYIEPIQGSGEQIIVAVVGRLEHSFEVRRTLSASLAQCMESTTNTSISSIIDVVIQSINNHMEKTTNLLDWVPPFSGTSIGEVHAISSNSISEVLDYVTASYTLFGDSGKQTNVAAKKPRSTGWVNEVFKSLRSEYPDQKRHIKQEVRLFNSHRATVIDFLSSKKVVNLAQIRPGNRLTTQLKHIKSKLWDLSEIKNYFERGSGDLLHFDDNKPQFEMIINPEKSDSDYNSSEILDFEGALNELEVSGDMNELRVHQASSIEETIKRLVA